MRTLKHAFCALLFCALGGCVHLPPVADMSHAVAREAGSPAMATVPFTFDDNRVFVEIAFVKPDGTRRTALAFVNMGQGGFVLSNALFRELAPLPGKPVRMMVGAMGIAVDGAAFQPDTLANNITIGFSSGAPSAAEAARQDSTAMTDFSAPLKVEAILPPGLLQHFTVVFDHAARTMTLAAPGTLTPQGERVPMRVDPATGFAVADVAIDGANHAFVLDNGGSYSGIRDSAPLLRTHPERLRAIGGIGEANLVMGPSAPEIDAPVVKVRGAQLGAVRLEELGLLDMGGQGMFGGLLGGVFWDRIYSAKAGEPVDGMLGGNVLKSFRLTLDYPNRASYWLQQAPLDTRDLDQVGLVLMRQKDVTTVASIAQKNGVPTVAGIEPGDKLLAIDGADTAPMTRGQLLAALHGKPGGMRHLLLLRGAKRVTVDAPVTAF
jgi:hypothetical protein